MMTREERHALAARIRLGETTPYPTMAHLDWAAPSPLALDNQFVYGWRYGRKQWEFYALGVLLATSDGQGPILWENGRCTEVNNARTLANITLTYLERD